MGKVYKLSTIPSTSEYVEGLSSIRSRINELQLRLLQEQYQAPNRTVTATQLAELVGVESGPGAINLQYGKLGRLFCETTGFQPSQRDVGTYRWWAVWSNGYEERKPYRFFWEMHPEVAKALELLGWVTPESVVLRTFPDEVDEAQVFREGAVCKVSVNAYERNPHARQKCIDHYGARCYACGFDFGKVFRAIGEGFIHVHHLRPISEIAEAYEVNPIEDLRPVCPNCHAMIHRCSPPLSIEEIQSILNDSKV
jgi:5-methylcytosine-specific restriction enzyme A